jgi:pimeloyl-ACP methyl ester carboxylesterase
MPVDAAIKSWPSAFHDQQMVVSAATQYVRVGGHGPAVLLLHGFGDTGDMWIPLAEILVKDHTVIIPDLRGMGLSSHQDGGYEKTAQARDLAIMDAPLPGIGHWDDQIKNPKVWHFNFRGPEERLVAGRERILLDRFYNELAATPANIDEQIRDHYAALHARPGAIHDAFSGQFAAFAQDAIDNQKLVAEGKLTLPVLAIGGDHSYGANLATEVGFAASNVRSAVVKNSGHWIMEEQPQQAIYETARKYKRKQIASEGKFTGRSEAPWNGTAPIMT